MISTAVRLRDPEREVEKGTSYSFEQIWGTLQHLAIKVLTVYLDVIASEKSLAESSEMPTAGHMKGHDMIRKQQSTKRYARVTVSRLGVCS